VIERLNASVARVAQSGALKSLEDVEGLTLVAGPPADLDKYVRGEAARWQDLINKSNLKLE
jgi:tripartite-type tricarboxylate transporter receptor subunit TctC